MSGNNNIIEDYGFFDVGKFVGIGRMNWGGVFCLFGVQQWEGWEGVWYNHFFE